MKYQNVGVPDSYMRYEALRNKAGATDSDIARKAAIRRATLSEWKAGLYTPKVDKLQRIATVLDVPLERLLA